MRARCWQEHTHVPSCGCWFGALDTGPYRSRHSAWSGPILFVRQRRCDVIDVTRPFLWSDCLQIRTHMQQGRSAIGRVVTYALASRISIDTTRLCYRRIQSRYRCGRVRAHSNCSIGSMGAEPACSSITPFGKHLLHNEPHFDVLVIVSDTAEPKRHPQTERRFCLGSAIASCGTRWHRPPSLTFTAKRFMIA